MRASINKWGNSFGLRIPKSFTEKIGITYGSEVEVQIIDEKIIIEKVSDPRYKWEELFKKAIDKGQLPEEEILDNSNNSFDEKEWTW